MRLPVAVALGVLAVAAPAQAATVLVTSVSSCAGSVSCSKYGDGYSVPVTAVLGARGEANRISVVREGEALVVRDAGAPPTAGDGCEAVAPDAVRCPLTPGQGSRIPGLAIDTGDGDDSVFLAGDAGLTVTLRGDDWINGDPPWGDGIYEEFFPRGTDRMSGGPGDDFIFDQRGGADLLSGGSGDDELYADWGMSVFVGGPGDDRIGARDARPDRVRCGRGRDRARLDGRDERSSCEHGMRRREFPPPPISGKGGRDG